MAIEAPICKFKKNNLKIYIIACLVFAAVLAYDGYLSKYEWSHRRSFYEKHVKEGKPDDTMKFNQITPIILVIFAAVLFGRFKALKDRRLLADENELILSDREKISFNSIQKIDKTNFDSKGYFVITHKDKNGNEINRKLSNKTYDNLTAVLNHIVAKIS